MENDLIYLAVPFTSDNKLIRETRFWTVTKIAADLMQNGELIFSPITMGWPIAQMFDHITTEWDYWEKVCRTYLSRCQKMYVVMMDGWKESKGVQSEIEIAKEMGITIEYIDPLLYNT